MYKLNARDHFKCFPLLFSWPASRNRCSRSEKVEIKTITSPQICCHTTLQNVSGQLHSYTAQLIQLKVMQQRLITANVQKGCYFCVRLHILIYHMCLKCPPSAHNACFEWCAPLVNGYVNVRCSIVCVPNVFLFKWKENATTKCRTNIVMMSVSGRKIIQQINTHKTDAAGHDAFSLIKM